MPLGSTWRTARQFWICCSTKPGNTDRICSVTPSSNSVKPASSERVLQAIAVGVRAQALLLVGGVAGGRGRGVEHRIAHVVAARFIDDQTTLLRQPVQLEGGEEQVQQAGVVAVLDVLHVQLPVVRQGLREAADHFHRLVQHALDALADLLAQVFLDVRHVFAEAAEHQAAVDRHAQLARAVLLLAEALAGMPPCPLTPFSKATPVRSPWRL